MNGQKAAIGGLRVIAAAFIIAVTGCSQNLRGTISPEAEDTFRAEALQTLLEAAGAEEPIVRMHAIEALKDVAPQAGLRAIGANIDNASPPVRFAALMAMGELREKTYLPRIQVRSEDTNPNVALAGIFAMHRLGDESRTSELSEFLLNHPDARVRANAALAIGRLEEPQSIRLLRVALKREQKEVVKSQILESMAMLGSKHAVERLVFSGYSDIPDQRFLAMTSLANAGSREAERLFLFKLEYDNQPEIRLQAARGLAKLGRNDGFDLALAYLLSSRSYSTERQDDPIEQQIPRIRGLAALALEEIGNPEALDALRRAFDERGQSTYVRLAIARAAIRIIDRQRAMSGYLPADGVADETTAR